MKWACWSVCNSSGQCCPHRAYLMPRSSSEARCSIPCSSNEFRARYTVTLSSRNFIFAIISLAARAVSCLRKRVNISVRIGVLLNPCACSRSAMNFCLFIHWILAISMLFSKSCQAIYSRCQFKNNRKSDNKLKFNCFPLIIFLSTEK